MKKISLIIPIFISGCVGQPIKLQDHAANSYHVPVSKLIIDNLAVDKKADISETQYVNGWAPIREPEFKPSLSQSLYAKTKNSIVADGQTGRVDVSILRAGLFVEKSVADDIVFVGFFTLGSKRGYKCDVDINVKSDKDSQRMTLSYEIQRTFFDNADQVRNFVEECQSNLVKQIADKAKDLSI